jgi:hypothetical protein
VDDPDLEQILQGQITQVLRSGGTGRQRQDKQWHRKKP